MYHQISMQWCYVHLMIAMARYLKVYIPTRNKWGCPYARWEKWDKPYGLY
jgi:hypothetical protein